MDIDKNTKLYFIKLSCVLKDGLIRLQSRDIRCW